MNDHPVRPSQSAPRVFLDADAIIAAAFAGSVESAAYVVLLLGEATLLDCVTSAQVLAEVTRDVARLVPDRVLEAELIVRRGCRIVDDPSSDRIADVAEWAHAKDAPILVAALEAGCETLVTFNTKRFQPPADQLAVMTPGAFLQHLRARLAGWGEPVATPPPPTPRGATSAPPHPRPRARRARGGA